MTTPLTYLPTRTTESLGVDKVDPSLTVAEVYQLALREYNVAADWILELATRLGVTGDLSIGNLEDSTGTLRGIMRRIGYGDPMLRRKLDHFEYRSNATTLDDSWDTAGAGTLLASTNLEGGQLILPQNLGLAEFLIDAGLHYHAKQAPVFEARMRCECDVGNPLVHLGFNEGTNHAGDGFGFYLHSAGPTVDVYVFSLVAGVQQQALVTTIAALAWFTVRVELRDDGIGNWHPWCSVDGDPYVPSLVQAVDDTQMLGRWIYQPAAAAVKFYHVDYIWTEADYSVAM